MPVTNHSTDGRETETVHLREVHGTLPAVAVWFTGTGEFKMHPWTSQKVGTKGESVVSCLRGGPFSEEGTKGDG